MVSSGERASPSFSGRAGPEAVTRVTKGAVFSEECGAEIDFVAASCGNGCSVYLILLAGFFKVATGRAAWSSSFADISGVGNVSEMARGW